MSRAHPGHHSPLNNGWRQLRHYNDPTMGSVTALTNMIHADQISWQPCMYYCPSACFINPLQWATRTLILMTLWHRNYFCITRLLCGEYTGHLYFPRANNADHWCTSCWIYSRIASDFTPHDVHSVIVIACIRDKNAKFWYFLSSAFQQPWVPFTNMD